VADAVEALGQHVHPTTTMTRLTTTGMLSVQMFGCSNPTSALSECAADRVCLLDLWVGTGMGWREFMETMADLAAGQPFAGYAQLSPKWCGGFLTLSTV
jgi:hypothetical protein